MKLIHGDCLKEMSDISDGSVDLILADPPYGTTACKWDSIIPLEPMWKQLKKITKHNTVICLFSQNPFTANLIMSNLEMYRYDWIWQKDQPKNFFFLKKQTGKIHEYINVFYQHQPCYNPQMRNGFKPQRSGNPFSDIKSHNLKLSNTEKKRDGKTDRYPISIIQFPSVKKSCHPTQKPVKLMEYLIKTYTNEGETVLDFCMGSGTTGVACMNTGRRFIGIELDAKYFEIAKKRIEEHNQPFQRTEPLN